MHCAVEVVRRTVKGVEFQRFFGGSIDDVVFGASRDDKSVPVANEVFFPVENNLCFTAFNSEKLVNLRMHLHPDVLVGLQTHHDQLGVGTGEEHLAEKIIGERYLFNIAAVAGHNFSPPLFLLYAFLSALSQDNAIIRKCMRILVVEDEHKVANSLKKGLEQESFAVDVAFTGNDGFDLAATEDYDLIILDLLLPGMSGVEICKKLREQGKHVPVLMLTAKGQLADKVEGLNAGADDYLVKPFAFEELLARVRALIRRPSNFAGNVLCLEDLSLDTVTYEVKRAGKPIQLSGKEFSLLEYLLRHPNHILTKEQIIGHVWDYEADILPNTVEVYIGYLRNKIDRPFPEKHSLIQTVRGFGYKLGKEK